MQRLLGVFSVLMLASCGMIAQSDSKKLTTEDLEKLLEKKDSIFFLDVREPDEIARLGSVKGYVNIPLGQLESRLKEVPKNRVIVTI
jgi:rhodanese-related sulfurtransferase